jgi:hypothetical protein
MFYRRKNQTEQELPSRHAEEFEKNRHTMSPVTRKIAAAAEREKGKRDAFFNRPKTPVRGLPLSPPPELPFSEDLTYIHHVHKQPAYLSELTSFKSETKMKTIAK